MIAAHPGGTLVATSDFCMRYNYFFRFLVLVACLQALPGYRAAHAGFLGNLGSRAGKTGTSQPFRGSADNYTKNLLRQAKEALESGRLELAEELYQNVLIRDSSNLEAITGLSETYKTMGKLEYARGLLIRASTLDPFNDSLLKKTSIVTSELSRTLHSEVDSLMANRRHDLAIPKLAILQTLEPENPELFYKKALCHLELGRPDVANLEIEKALRLNDKEAYHRLHKRIHIGLRESEIQSLLQKARALMQSDSIESKQEILSYLGRILALDHDNTWAREQFFRFSENGGTKDRLQLNGLRKDLQSSTKDLVYTSLQQLRKVPSKLASLIGQYPEVILITILVLLTAFSPLTQAILRGIPPRSLLSGKLCQFSLPEILTLINSQACTGILSVRSKTASGEVFFENGEPYHCRTGDLKGKEALRKLLHGVKEGHFNFTLKSSSVEKTIETPLSLIIMDLPDRKHAPQTHRRARRPKSKLTELLEEKIE